MVFDLLAVKAEIDVNAVLLIQRDRRRERERNPLVCGAEQRLHGYLIFVNAGSVKFAQPLDLCARLVFAGIQKVRRNAPAFEFERAEL